MLIALLLPTVIMAIVAVGPALPVIVQHHRVIVMIVVIVLLTIAVVIISVPPRVVQQAATATATAVAVPHHALQVLDVPVRKFVAMEHVNPVAHQNLVVRTTRQGIKFAKI